MRITGQRYNIDRTYRGPDTFNVLMAGGYWCAVKDPLQGLALSRAAIYSKDDELVRTIYADTLMTMLLKQGYKPVIFKIVEEEINRHPGVRVVTYYKMEKVK